MEMKHLMEIIGKIAGLAALFVAFYVSISLFMQEINESGFRDAAIFFWTAYLMLITFAGAAGAWRKRPRYVWASGFILSVFSVLAMFSIGNLTLPIAFLLLFSAISLTMANRFFSYQDKHKKDL